MIKRKKLILCVLIFVMVFLLSGCMKMHIDIVWKEDNSGSISMTTGVALSALGMFEMSVEDIHAQLRESAPVEGDEVTVVNFEDDEYAGIIITQQIDDMTSNDSEEVEQLKFDFSQQGGTKIYTVSGEFDGASALGDTSGAESMGVSLEDYDMKISIVMPGRITSHNATDKSGNKLTWDLTGGDVTSINAVSEVGGGGGIVDILMWVLFVLSSLVLVGAVVLIIMKSQNKAPRY